SAPLSFSAPAFPSTFKSFSSSFAFTFTASPLSTGARITCWATLFLTPAADPGARHKLVQIAGSEDFVTFRSIQYVVEFTFVLSRMNRGLFHDTFVDDVDRRHARQVVNCFFRHGYDILVAIHKNVSLRKESWFQLVRGVIHQYFGDECA